MNKRMIFAGALLLVLLLAVPVTVALAECVPGNTGTAGDDTITCTGTTTSVVNGGDGNDIITNNGALPDDDLEGGGGNDTLVNNNTMGTLSDWSNMTGGSGNDTMINNGTMHRGNMEGDDGNDTLINNGTMHRGNMEGDDGNDTLINNGTVVFNVQGDDGNDLLINNGTVAFNVQGGDGDDVLIINGRVTNTSSFPTVRGDDGNDSVRILDRASIIGRIDGGTGDETIGDALHLDFRQREATPEEYFWFVEAMEAASATGGYVCWMSNCYTWSNFEHLSWRLDYNFGPAAIYFIDVPLEELPVYGDGTAPFCTFYSGQHGPKWIASEQCGDFPDASALDVVCLNDTGMWSSGNVSGLGADADGKLSFSTSQHGICGVYPSS